MSRKFEHAVLCQVTTLDANNMMTQLNEMSGLVKNLLQVYIHQELTNYNHNNLRTPTTDMLTVLGDWKNSNSYVEDKNFITEMYITKLKDVAHIMAKSKNVDNNLNAFKSKQIQNKYEQKIL